MAVSISYMLALYAAFVIPWIPFFGHLSVKAHFSSMHYSEIGIFLHLIASFILLAVVYYFNFRGRPLDSILDEFKHKKRIVGDWILIVLPFLIFLSSSTISVMVVGGTIGAARFNGVLPP